MSRHTLKTYKHSLFHTSYVHIMYFALACSVYAALKVMVVCCELCLACRLPTADLSNYKLRYLVSFILKSFSINQTNRISSCASRLGLVTWSRSGFWVLGFLPSKYERSKNTFKYKKTTTNRTNNYSQIV